MQFIFFRNPVQAKLYTFPN